ncbi:MAG: flagellar hook-length control protein FliK [Gammaproteobacteria bacterium]|nr:flagellar hook-length control protein FliK [Gammaproteobacteria bacterium]
MDISGIQNTLKLDLLARSPQAVVDAWKVGQLVTATAVTTPRHGQATLTIGGALVSAQLPAQTPFGLTPGQPLQLEVSRLAELTVLRLITQTANAGRPEAAAPITISLLPQPGLIRQLTPGQQLMARLQIPLEQQPTRAILEWAGNRIAVQLSQALPATVNQPLKLEVLHPGAIAALKILTPATTASDSIPQALRATLPRQAPLPPLLSNLALIAGDGRYSFLPNAPRPAPALPPAVVELSRAIIERLPQPATLGTADGVRQAVAQSGLFLEARLAQALQQSPQQNLNPLAAAIPIDFKGGLLGLLVTLLGLIKSSPATPTPATPPIPTHAPSAAPAAGQATLNPSMGLQQALAELLRSVESGVARLQLNQLVSSAPEEEGKRSWVLELPVRGEGHIDLIRLCIDQQRPPQGKKDTAFWTVTLSLSPKGLGPVQVRVSLVKGTIHTRFWSENPHTSDFIRDHLPLLKQRYREVGLSIGQLQAHQGKAPGPSSADDYLHPALLDEQA